MGTTFDDYERAQWAGRASAYQRSFAALCAHPAAALLDAAAAGPGTSLLDAGTGTGTVAAQAAERGACVTAVDAEPTMLDLTRQRVPAAEVRLAVLPHLPFEDGTFDAAAGNFVLNHVGDPLAAVVEISRVVRPGGRVALTIWPYPAPPAQALWGTVFDAAGVERPTDLPRLDADKDFPRTEEGFAGLLGRSGGLAGITCETIAWIHRTDPESWWSGPANGISTPGLLLNRQSAATKDRIRREYDRLTAAFREPGGRLALPTSALLASATVEARPGR